LEPDLGYTVDAAALKIPGAELHIFLLHLCEAWRCRVEEVFHFLFHSVRFFFLMQYGFQCNVESLLLFLFQESLQEQHAPNFKKQPT